MELISKESNTIVQFRINGKEYKVSGNDGLTPESKLVDFIREKAVLTGTKFMCREGGCGACIVTVRIYDQKTKTFIPKAVNSCLVSVFGCNGWDIYTVEFLGNKYTDRGYHPILDRMVKFSASQCGFCSPGMAMNMYSLVESKSDVKVEDVENMLDSNICRCTGYRPILDAFKSLASDSPKRVQNWCQDIEDCEGCPKMLASSNLISQPFPHRILSDLDDNTVDFKMEPNGNQQQWISVHSLNSAFRAINSFKIDSNQDLSYRIVAGNTGHGVYRYDPVKYYVDINSISELKDYSVNEKEITLGSCVTLADTMRILQDVVKMRGFAYTGEISKHLRRVANTSVRNIGTLGGNLMLKYTHKEFPSDVFLLLETVGAKVVVGSAPRSTREYSPAEFLYTVKMEGKLVIAIKLFPLEGNYNFHSFKIAARNQNSKAHINAGLLIKVQTVVNTFVVEKPRIVYGGISPTFVRATETEKYLTNKRLDSEETLRGVWSILDSEVIPKEEPGELSPAYKKIVAKSLFYKVVLRILSPKVNSVLRSGGDNLVYKPSKGKQTYTEGTDKIALYKAIPKLEATLQVSGEAEFVGDMPPLPNELFGVFVLTTVAKAELDSIDTSKAMSIDGVVRFITIKDIPGSKNFMEFGPFPVETVPEAVFVIDKVYYAGQAVGLLLATSRETAIYAASKVIVKYKNVQKPLVDIEDAVRMAERNGTLESYVKGTFNLEQTSDEKATVEIRGEFRMGAQYAYHMETQNCICIPKDDSMDIYSGTQWLNHVQVHVATALNLPQNYFNVQLKRLGGAFGAKTTRATMLAIPCAVAAYLTNRPVRVVQDMEINMAMMGWRPSYLTKYTVKCNNEGKIIELKVYIFGTSGVTPNEADSSIITPFQIQSAYKAYGWEIKIGDFPTDIAAVSLVRAPGSLNAIALMENIMEHIAFELKLDPVEVRAVNYKTNGDLSIVDKQPIEEENLIPRMVAEVKSKSNYEMRKESVKKFNEENRWKKRGIALSISSMEILYLKFIYQVYVAIYHRDGSVSVTHGGISMGQGINTKVAQAVSSTLKIPLQKIKIKQTNSLTANNASPTGSSTNSEACAYAAIQACNTLVKRMKPIKDSLGSGATWEQIVEESFKRRIDLTSFYMFDPNNIADTKKPYKANGVIATEVEVDVLTGEYKVVRVDLLEDAGKSLNPLLDMGQMEGAYVMGQGLWTSEKMIYNKSSGQLLTTRSWNYKPPQSKDIPEDFRLMILDDAPNPNGILRSKAAMEPPICTSVSVLFALKNAIHSARKAVGNTKWFQLDGPVSSEDVVRHSLTSSSDFLLQ